MKTLTIGLLIILLLSLPLPALAQDPTAEPTIEATAVPDVTILPDPVVPPPFPVEIPDELPDTALKGVDILAVMLGALAGLIAKYLTNAIKALPFLTEGDKDKITGPAATALAAVVSVAVGYILAYAGVAANFLDTSGVWQVLVTAWPWAVKWYHDSRKPVVVAPDSEVHITA